MGLCTVPTVMSEPWRTLSRMTTVWVLMVYLVEVPTGYHKLGDLVSVWSTQESCERMRAVQGAGLPSGAPVYQCVETPVGELPPKKRS